MDILIVVPHPVFRMAYMKSQVISQFEYLASLGWRVRMLSVGDLTDPVVAEFLSDLGRRGIHGSLIPPATSPLKTYRRAIAIAAAILRKERPHAVYTREPWGNLVANFARGMARIGGVRIIYDVRGATPEEITFHDKSLRSALKGPLFSVLEKISVSRASAINAVTKELSEHVWGKYGRRADTLIPCCVPALPAISEELRCSLREAYGFEPGHTVYVYSGGSSKWQMFAETIAFFNLILQADETARFLILTPDRKNAAAVLSDTLPQTAYRLASVPQGEVTAHLTAGDVGFILREDVVVNNVAFPIKFGEYLSAGLTVVTSPGLTEIARITREEELGLVVDPSCGNATPVIQWTKSVMAGRDSYRQRARRYAQQHLLWSSHLGDFQKLYGRSL